ncbi:MAG: hypothetical protein KIT09_14805 [Bryobacteraceae bacterium]|nr:hypothetical protein [Bryobacteraceae bacterium]
MKTTIDIGSNIFEAAKRLAREENTTFRDLVEEGLELVLEQRSARRKIQIKPVTFRGRGLTAEYRDASWSKIRGEV